VHTRFSDSGNDLQDPRHTRVSLPIVVGFVEEPVYVWLSGAKGEELTAALALCMGGIDLMQPPAPQSEVFTPRPLRKKRKKRRK
jgi:hypothetical protein